MANEEVIVQTADEVTKIDYMRVTNDILAEHNDTIQETINNISEQLDIIESNTNNIETPTSSVDLSEVVEIIEDIGQVDTAVVESNTQDILVKLNQQQEQINDINNKLNMILEKL